MSKGTIALDVDGTIASSWRGISLPVINRLTQLAADGWTIAFITGRMCGSVLPALAPLNFPYLLAVQNGAVLLRMPEKEVLDTLGVDCSCFSTLDEISADSPTDYALYTGAHHGDVIYYRPDCYSPEVLTVIKKRMERCEESWVAVETYEPLPLTQVASIKFIGSHDIVSPLAKRTVEKLGLHIPVIKDPVSKEHFVAQGTHPDAHKGGALTRLPSWGQGPVIAAGDDTNDITLLEAATIGIAMGTAPDSLREAADWVAPPVEEDGILAGLDWALKRLGD